VLQILKAQGGAAAAAADVHTRAGAVRATLADDAD